MADSLDLALGREVIMLVSNVAGGKSYSVAHLVNHVCNELKRNVVLIDSDRGVVKAFKEVMPKVPETLDYFNCTTDFAKYAEATRLAEATLLPGDWLIFDHAHRLWDACQEHYTEDVWDMDMVENQERKLKAAADFVKTKQEQGALVNEYNEMQSAIQYNGFGGRTEWPIIKKHHYNILPRTIKRGDFNVLVTLNLQALPESEATKWPMWSGLGRRPQGENNNEEHVDTIIVTEIGRGGDHTWRTDLGGGKHKDRGGREAVKGMNFEGTGVVQSYYDYFGLEF